MSTIRVKLLSIFILVVLVGCSAFPFGQATHSATTPILPVESQSPPTIIPSESPGSIRPTATATTGIATPTGNSTVLQVWLPPEFDPNANEVASGYLKARLDEFTSANPGVNLEIRIKALEGAGGMLESLVAANAAAPKALPDLVLLPRPLLESAALKGLLFPYDGLTNIMDDQNWFEYARQLAHINTSTYGIPFAGDAMVLAHRPSLLGVSPHNLETTISLGEVMLYPAADPQALFTISLYLASGGSLQDAQGRPMIDEAGVTQILEFDKRASLAGVMPVALTEYTNDTQVWEIFKGTASPMAITWASIYLNDQLTLQDDVTLAPIPTPDGLPFTLATGWGWVLTGKDEAKRTSSVRLAEFLVDKDFLAKWTSAAGYLPPRVDALQSWQESVTRQVIEQISYSAWLLPPEDLVSSIGPALEQAVVNVIKAESEPQTAAQTVVNQVNQP